MAEARVEASLPRRTTVFSPAPVIALCGGAYAVERAADPLHRARINAKALGDLAHAVGVQF